MYLWDRSWYAKIQQAKHTYIYNTIAFICKRTDSEKRKKRDEFENLHSEHVKNP